MNYFYKIAMATLCLTAMLGLASQSIAADYPSKRITIIVPYSAGGATDILARQMAEGLSSVLGETVSVENRAGAGATLGAAQAAHARADGYTLFMGQVSSNGIAPAIYKNLQYDAKKDFEPIIWIDSIPNVMVVSADSDIKSVQGFIDAAKTKKMTFGSSGTGSSIHLSGEMFKSRTGVKMTHVPFRGSGAAMPALISGDVDVMFDNLPSAISHIKSGGLRALAVTTEQRSAALPDVPTLEQTGVPALKGFSAMSWFGLFAPAETDKAIVKKLNEASQKVLASDSFKKYAKTNGAMIMGGSPEQLGKHVDSELAKWQKVVQEAGVSVK